VNPIQVSHNISGSFLAAGDEVSDEQRVWFTTKTLHSTQQQRRILFTHTSHYEVTTLLGHTKVKVICEERIPIMSHVKLII